MLVLLTDQQHFSTCWPRVCTVPLEMSICTLACMITQNKKRKDNPFCTTVRSIGNEIHWCLCEQSKAMYGVKPSISSACERAKEESKRKDFLFFCQKEKTKWTSLCHENLSQKSWTFHYEAEFLYKHDGAAFAEIERHATAFVTQIFYIGYCVILDIGPHLSRPSLTQWLITCFLLYLQNL